jgi:hypothetical protein
VARVASEPAAVATIEIDHTSSRMSSTRPGVVTGFAICEETVVSCAVTQNSAPPRSSKSEPSAPPSNQYMSTVPTASTTSVNAISSVSRARRNWCVRVSPRRTIRASLVMCDTVGRTVVMR